MEKSFTVESYDLAATLTSGQAFRWRWFEGGWEGVVGRRSVRLAEAGPLDGGLPGRSGIIAQVREPVPDWIWLEEYLQLGIDFERVLASFPDDLPMRAAVNACRGLRLLRQDPWECLASFILSSTKQIVQIRQMVEMLCERYGERIPGTWAGRAAFAFPSAERLAQCAESELRECKLGFRAAYLREAARQIASGQVRLGELKEASLEKAREALVQLPGVGCKIADCVLLFAYGFPRAFPVDVWVFRALRELYFPRKRKIKLRDLARFIDRQFGPNAGYAQQYLFHYMRTRGPKQNA